MPRFARHQQPHRTRANLAAWGRVIAAEGSASTSAIDLVLSDRGVKPLLHCVCAGLLPNLNCTMKAVAINVGRSVHLNAAGTRIRLCCGFSRVRDTR